MSYEGLTRPNNFMLGYKPFSNVIYDESITPLEMLNKLAYKLNEIVASDSNVKDNVDKLLGVWKDAFMVKAGYIEPIETIYSENPIQVVKHVLINNVQLSEKDGVYFIDESDRYKGIQLYFELNCNANITIYKDGEKILTSNSLPVFNSTVYLPSKSNSMTLKAVIQNENYTKYLYFKFFVLESEYHFQEKIVDPKYEQFTVTADSPKYDALKKVTLNKCPFSETSNKYGITVNM